jgi:hypothetical protein
VWSHQVELNEFITLTVEDQANVRADFKCQEQKMSFQVSDFDRRGNNDLEPENQGHNLA